MSLIDDIVAKSKEYDDYVKAVKTIPQELVFAYNQLVIASFEQAKDIELGKELGKKAKEYCRELIKQSTNGGDFEWLENEMQKCGESYGLVQLYYSILKAEAPHVLDSYCLYVEKDRPKKERFYEPRRRTLVKVCDKLQALEEDKLDRLFIHMPPRVGKSQLMTMYACWHICRHTEQSNLYATYKESLGGAFLDGVKEILTDPTYCHTDVFADAPIVFTDAKNNKIDLKRKKKYKSLSGKGLESGLNGEYDATGVLIIDDIIEGIQDAMNPDILNRKKIVFDNNLKSRAKEKCKIIYNGTIWSLHDIYMGELNFLESNPQAAHIRWEIFKIPALNENDESNFDYDYDVGFSTEHYRTLRAKFEENEDLASWYAQYQQEPIERDGAVFNPEHMRFYNGILPNEEPLKIVGACDVALGGKDYLAFPIAYVYEDGSVYIHDVVFDNAEKDITQPQVINAIINNNLGSAFFEANQGGEGYKDDIDRLLKEHKEFNSGRGINLTSAYAPTSKRKEQRIWDNAPNIRQFYFRDSTCQSLQYRKFMTNVYSFTINGKNKFDDAPDSLSTLADYIYKGSGVRVANIMNCPF